MSPVPVYALAVPDTLSVDEASREFHRSRKWFFDMIRQGKLTKYKSEGDQRTLVDRDEVRKLIEPRPQS